LLELLILEREQEKAVVPAFFSILNFIFYNLIVFDELPNKMVFKYYLLYGLNCRK